VEECGRKYVQQRGMEETPENSKESSYFAHANAMNEHVLKKLLISWEPNKIK
jgi:hypothetical protein